MVWCFTQHYEDARIPPSPRLPFAWRFGSVRLLQIDSSFVYLVDGPQGQKVFCLGEGHTCRFTAA